MPSLSRQALYDLVWSAPMKTLAAAHGISDVGLKKVCAKAGIPVPERGYWAKHAAGRPIRQPSLPLRDPGLSDTVSWGPSSSVWSWPRDLEKAVAAPLPPPPAFDEPMADVQARIRKRLGKVRYVRDLDRPHVDIRKLFEKDEKRRAKIAQWSYYATQDPPVFEGGFELRRLRILNSLFLGFAQAGCKGQVTGNAGRMIYVLVGDTRFAIGLDHPDAKPGRHGEERAYGGPGGPLRLHAPTADPASDTGQTWVDDDRGKLEQKLTDIAVGIIVAGEAIHRRAEQRRYDHATKQREDDLVALEKRRAAVIEAERQRLAEEAQRQRDALLSQARDWRAAADLRAFVASVRSATAATSDIKAWAAWALGVADALDPLLNEAFTRTGLGRFDTRGR